MADELPPARPTSATSSSFSLEGLSKAAVLLGSIIAVGQAATSCVTGYWHAQEERARGQKELALAELKDKSTLAESYIKLIIDKNTNEQDRVMLLGALSELKDHPLQPWAKARYEQIRKSVGELEQASQAQFEGRQLKSEGEREQAALESDIAALNAEIALNRENVAGTKVLLAQRVEKSTQLLQLRARLSVESVRVAAGVPAPGAQRAGAPGTVPDPAAAITALAHKVDVRLLMSVFPERSRANVEANVKYLAAAMQEFKITDPRMVATIIATILVETPTFEAYEEPQSRFNTENTPFDRYDNRMGNTEPGDGARFRGRGFLGLTGRSNYAQMSKRLGLGTRLIDSPDDARSPEVAARIVCAYFVDRQDRVTRALDRDDLTDIRRIVSGGTNQVQPFSAAYRKVLDQLKA